MVCVGTIVSYCKVCIYTVIFQFLYLHPLSKLKFTKLSCECMLHKHCEILKNKSSIDPLCQVQPKLISFRERNTTLKLMVAYFCHHLSDYNVDSSDLYVDLSVIPCIHVELSDYYVDFSEKY